MNLVVRVSSDFGGFNLIGKTFDGDLLTAGDQLTRGHGHQEEPRYPDFDDLTTTLPQ
jgi:hypothetical protein